MTVIVEAHCSARRSRRALRGRRQLLMRTNSTLPGVGDADRATGATPQAVGRPRRVLFRLDNRTTREVRGNRNAGCGSNMTGEQIHGLRRPSSRRGYESTQRQKRTSMSHSGNRRFYQIVKADRTEISNIRDAGKGSTIREETKRRSSQPIAFVFNMVHQQIKGEPPIQGTRINAMSFVTSSGGSSIVRGSTPAPAAVGDPPSPDTFDHPSWSADARLE